MNNIRVICGIRNVLLTQSKVPAWCSCSRVNQNIWSRPTSTTFKRMFVSISRNGHQRLPLSEGLQRSFIISNINKVPHQKAVRCASVSSKPSDGGRLIYSGDLAKPVLGVKFFSYSCSMFSVCVMPYVLMQTGLGVQSLALQVAFCGIIGFFTFITPVLLHFITKGYVIRLYHHEEADTYTAVTYSALLTEKKTMFHQSDVKVPDISKMFTTFYAKKHSMLVNPDTFSLPHDYNHLMGYDRPFTFDVDDLDKPDGK